MIEYRDPFKPRQLRYPAAAGFKSTDTSLAAALDIDPQRKMIRDRVLFSLRNAGPATATELARRLGIILDDVKPRLSELRAERLVEDTGKRGPTVYGKSSIVWGALG